MMIKTNSSEKENQDRNRYSHNSIHVKYMPFHSGGIASQNFTFTWRLHECMRIFALDHWCCAVTPFEFQEPNQRTGAMQMISPLLLHVRNGFRYQLHFIETVLPFPCHQNAVIIIIKSLKLVSYRVRIRN